MGLQARDTDSHLKVKLGISINNLGEKAYEHALKSCMRGRPRK